MQYFSKSFPLYLILASIRCFTCVNANAQYQNTEIEVMRPLRKMADSLLINSKNIFSPKDAAEYLLNEKSTTRYPVRIQVDYPNSKSLSHKDIFEKDKSAVGLVAMCSKPNILNEVFINPASAFVISSDGICLTNYHVIYAYAHSKTVQDKGIFLIRLGNGRTYVLDKILGVSPQNDLAMIKLDVKKDILPYLKLSESDAEVGEEANILGNSFGQLYSFTSGMVSGKYNETMLLPGGTGRALRNVMSVTADFSVGASGSPILDNKGNVIGVVSSTNIVEQPINGHPMTQMVIKNTIPVSSINNLIQSIVADNQ